MKRLICFALVTALTVASIGCGKANQDFVKEPNIENTQEENIPEPTNTLPPTQETTTPTLNNPEPTKPITVNPPNWPNNLCGILNDIHIYTYIIPNEYYNTSVINTGKEIIIEHRGNHRSTNLFNLKLDTGQIIADTYGISTSHHESMPGDQDYVKWLKAILFHLKQQQHHVQSNADKQALQLIIKVVESIIFVFENPDKINLIDDFNDYDITNPFWYKWDIPGWSDVSLEYREERFGVDRFMRINFSGVDDYVNAPNYPGGFGIYVGKTASSNQYLYFKYRNGKDISHFGFDLFRFGNSLAAYMQVQLVDDDNNNYIIEDDTSGGYHLLYDDQFVFSGMQDISPSDPAYNQKTTYTFGGWGEVVIPLSRFVDINPGVGDDIFNPEQQNGSGGLLSIQFNFIRGKYPITEEIVDIDDVKIISASEIPTSALVFD